MIGNEVFEGVVLGAPIQGIRIRHVIGCWQGSWLFTNYTCNCQPFPLPRLGKRTQHHGVHHTEYGGIWPLHQEQE